MGLSILKEMTALFIFEVTNCDLKNIPQNGALQQGFQPFKGWKP